MSAETRCTGYVAVGVGSLSFRRDVSSWLPGRTPHADSRLASRANETRVITDRFSIFSLAIQGPDVRLARSSRDRQFHGCHAGQPLRSPPTYREDVLCRATPDPAARP